jgi:hypothetical protein
VFRLDKPVSVFFDACVVIDQGGCGGIGCDCGSLDMSNKSNNKYMHWGDNSWPCDGVDSYYCPYWGGFLWATQQREKDTALIHMRIAAPDCASGTCNPVNFIVLKPSDWKQGHIISIRIDGMGFDPGTLMHLNLVTDTHGNSSYQVFHSFHKEMRSEFSISTKAKNSFLSLTESITQTLNITSCYVCGRTNIGDH